MRLDWAITGSVLSAAIAAQLLLFAGHLSFGPRKGGEVRLLLIGLTGALGLVSLATAMGGIAAGDGLSAVLLILRLLIGPLALLYARRARVDAAPLSAGSFVHGLPAVAGLVVAVTGPAQLLDPLVYGSLAAYVIAIIFTLRRSDYPNPHLRDFLWWLTGSLAALSVLLVLVSIQGWSRGDYRETPAFPLALLLMLTLSSRMLLTTFTSGGAVLLGERAPEKYGGQLPEVEALDRLHAAFARLLVEERIYREAGLTAEIVAQRLNVSQRQLSQMINLRYGDNFSAVINRRRVEEVADRLPLGERVTTLMYEAGFNSKSAFNREFVRRFGVTPTSYRRDLSLEARG